MGLSLLEEINEIIKNAFISKGYEISRKSCKTFR